MPRTELDIDPGVTRHDGWLRQTQFPANGDQGAPNGPFQLERRREHVILTASLTSGVARVARGMQASVRLVNEILATDHVEWETTLYVGEVEFHRGNDGPIPNHQLRISVRPSSGFAALNYMDHDDPQMPIANSYSLRRPLPEVDLIFNGTTGAVFPRTAAIPVADARQALIEWLKTWKRPTCIEWRPYDRY